MQNYQGIKENDMIQMQKSYNLLITQQKKVEIGTKLNLDPNLSG